MAACALHVHIAVLARPDRAPLRVIFVNPSQAVSFAQTHATLLDMEDRYVTPAPRLETRPLALPEAGRPESPAAQVPLNLETLDALFDQAIAARPIALNNFDYLEGLPWD